MKHQINAMALILGIAVCANAQSEMLTFSFSDVAGDNRPGYADITKLSAVFENRTGDYEITVRSTEGSQFQGWVQVNSNLVNPDIPRFITSQAYFFDSPRIITLDSPSSVVTWTGNAPSLMWWKAGARVATSSEPFGIARFTPPHSFSSSVSQGMDYLQWGTDDLSSTQIVTISAVPEAKNYAMLLAGLGLLAFRRRKHLAPLT